MHRANCRAFQLGNVRAPGTLTWNLQAGHLPVPVPQHHGPSGILGDTPPQPLHTPCFSSSTHLVSLSPMLVRSDGKLLTAFFFLLMKNHLKKTKQKKPLGFSYEVEQKPPLQEGKRGVVFELCRGLGVLKLSLVCGQPAGKGQPVLRRRAGTPQHWASLRTPITNSYSLVNLPPLELT